MVVACRRWVTLVPTRSHAEQVRWIVRRRGVLTSNLGYEACALVRLRRGAVAPDLELLFAPAPFLERPVKQHAVTVGVVLLQPVSTGAITLGSPNPLVAPVIQPRYLSDRGGTDLRLLVRGMKLARRVLATSPLAEYCGTPIEPPASVESDSALAMYVRRRADTFHHPVGTCRMGSGADAVVDPELRVRGVERLRVADASIMPRIVRGHVNAPSIMIGEKAADLILSSREPATI
jgi:choline dehydrogenase